jgi:hypothetical protein
MYNSHSTNEICSGNVLLLSEIKEQTKKTKKTKTKTMCGKNVTG